MKKAKATLFALAACGLAAAAYGATPQTMSFQGQLTNLAGTPLSGTYNLQFSIWDCPSCGTASPDELWTETQSGVVITSGVASSRSRF